MKKPDLGKWKFSRKLENLEVYLLAADNPVGKKQLRPIFRRKRNREVLTREQVTAIKRGRRVLRREMKERGLKRRIDFEITATNLGLFFDRNRLLWPFFLWLIRDNTVAKILATTAVLTTVLTVTEPVIEYITQYITQYVTQYITQYITQYVEEYWEKDRFTVSLSDEMFNRGLQLSETPGFEDPKNVLICSPAWDVPCVSISEIPADIDMTDGNHHDIYFAYTFYCRYVDNEATQQNDQGMEDFDLETFATTYDWSILIGNEGLSTEDEDSSTSSTEATAGDDTEDGTEGDTSLKVSDATWVMVIQDDEVILCAKAAKNGELEMLPNQETLETKKIAFIDWSVDYINAGLARIDPRLNMDTVSQLNTLFTNEEDIAACQEKIAAFYETAGVSSLTQLMLRTDNWNDHYQVVASRGDNDFYRVIPESFVSDTTVVERKEVKALPYLEEDPNMHKYTVVIWLEGDDPECTNALMNGHISLNFQIKGEGEDYMTEIITPTDPTAETEAA